MSLWSRFKNLDRAFAWSFLGFIVGIWGLAGAGFGVWAYFNSPSPRLTYEVLTNTPVFDVREKVDELQVLYKDIDITDGDFILQVITFRVVNNGQVDIKKDFYDAENSPLGIRLSEGEIVENPVIISSSNEYLDESLKLDVIDSKEVQIQPVILNSGDFFTIKLLALISSESVDLEATGKIAGINSIELKELYESDIEFATDDQINITLTSSRLTAVTLSSILTIGVICVLSLIILRIRK